VCEATAIIRGAADDEEMHGGREGRDRLDGRDRKTVTLPPVLPFQPLPAYCCAVVFPAVPRNPWICFTA